MFNMIYTLYLINDYKIAKCYGTDINYVLYSNCFVIFVEGEDEYEKPK